MLAYKNKKEELWIFADRQSIPQTLFNELDTSVILIYGLSTRI